MLNNDYVTPPEVRAVGCRTSASTRTATSPTATIGRRFYGAWQPRLGVSYDLTGDGRARSSSAGTAATTIASSTTTAWTSDFRLQYSGA